MWLNRPQASENDPSRRCVLAGTVGMAALSAGRALAQQWPTRTVKIIVPYAPGGAADTLARLVATGLTQKLNQSVIVENKAGGAGIPGTDAVIRSTDGHTIGLIVSVHASSVALKMQLPYDAIRDIRPLTLIGEVPLVLVVHPSVKATTVNELVEAARQNPGKLFCATSGFGTGGHFALELLKLERGLDIKAVHYKGAAPAAQDLVGGHVQMQFATLSSVWPNVEAGTLRALAISTQTRSNLHPTLPTVAEGTGIPGFHIVEWYGLIAPPTMPAPLAQRLQASVVQVLTSDDVQAKSRQLGIEIRATSPEGLLRVIQTDIERLGEVVRRSGMKME